MSPNVITSVQHHNT